MKSPVEERTKSTRVRRNDV